MIIVSDTGPLIALAKMDHLRLLEKPFSEVYIPPTVPTEVKIATLRLDPDGYWLSDEFLNTVTKLAGER